MFDVFYSGTKPNRFAHEQAADSIDHARELSRTRYFWWINYLTDYTGFDFLWEPTPWESHQCHAWPSQWQKDSGTYLVPKQGYEETNYRSGPSLIRLANETNWRGMGLIDISWHPDPTEPAMIYQFGTQHQKTGGPQYVVPGASNVKYINNPRVNKTSIDNYWVTPGAVDTESFDFTWHTDDTDPPYIYQFGTQHQRTGGPQYVVPGAVDVKYIDQIRIRTQRVATAIYEIDHMCGNSGKIPGTTRTVRYFDNYLDILKRIAKGVGDEHEFVWICSSICDYTNFDFTWHPEQWQAGMLHVFPSDGQKFGDTFFMHVPTFRYRADKCQLLDWYDINYMDKNVPRRPLPLVHHTYDTHVEAVKHMDFAGPLAIYTTEDSTYCKINQLLTKHTPAVPLWREKIKTIVPVSPGGSICIVPKTAVPYVKSQLYDYPNIDRTQRHMFKDELLDIVFIDNGEPNADANYEYLKWAAERANDLRIHRSSGVNGRVAAYQAAAKLSTTPWFFAVFAKLEVSSLFDWTWQPDRLQEPKHYIFHAYNPVNGLTYGHQAMIAYNKKLVLANPGVGLDFTLDNEHEVVPILSGVAEYAYTKWSAWRTAFRECIKLRGNSDVESLYRLDKWLTVDLSHSNGEYSILGAQDAVEYYEAVGGDFAELRKSYDWEWLASYALIKRNLTPSQ
jgi:hypothetical protein